MSRTEHGAPRNRIEILEEESEIHGSLEKHFLGRAAAAAAEGDMDAFRWAMDTSRRAGEDAAALSRIVRVEHNERLRDLSMMRILAGNVLPPFPATPLARRFYEDRPLGEAFDDPGDKHPRVNPADFLGPLTATRFDESALEHIRQAMAGSDPIIILETHPHGATRAFQNIPPIVDIMDGMVAHRPDDFPRAG